MATPRRTTGAPSADRRQRHRRDAGLDRARSLTRTVGVASVAAVAAFGIYLSRALPGHSAQPAGASSSSSSGAAANADNSTAQGGGLAPPNSPPGQSQQQAPVVSGSS